jgi:chaperonin GroEL
MESNILIDDLNKFDLGFKITCNAIAKTLGGQGKFALLESLQHNIPPQLTKDGADTAARIRFKDKSMNFGALQIISATAQVLSKVGDNTTTCAVLAREFVKNANRKTFNKSVERGIDIAVEEVREQIKYLAQPVNKEILEKIAITSCNGDEVLGSKIIDAYTQVGYEGIVSTKLDDFSEEVTVISQSGMKLTKGMANYGFINNNSKANWEGKNVLVVALETYQSDDNIMNFIRANRKNDNDELQPILFVVEKQNADFQNRVLDLIEAGHVDCCMVLAENSHNEHQCITGLRDIALFTEGISYHPKHSTIKAGFADSVVVDSENTYIVKANLSQDVLDKITELKTKSENNDFIKQRIQKLEGKSVCINIGGKSPNDRSEIEARIDDALKAVKAATFEGWVAGGASTLVYISARMNKKLVNIDEQIGYNLTKEVIQSPAIQILENSNRKEASLWVSRFFFGGQPYLKHSKKTYGVGYNAKTDKIENLIGLGIIDSAKGIRVALESAKECAVKMLLTSVIVMLPE